ncbi:MAG: OPT/YSL family transporter, partial [Eggerthellaceae bacterium]|nr:OPT/YSL family transporter [Eggerthellaceae bacterium]
MGQFKGQLTIRGVLIGSIGCIVISATSVYIALKMGALPWPIIFAALISLFFLKALGKTNYHEVNVTHTIMSGGAMVAGGLAFTIPGIWIIGAGEVSLWQMFVVAIAGVVLGALCTAGLRKYFIEDTQLEFPIGTAAASTIVAGDKGGKMGLKLLCSMGLAGVYTALRDWFLAIPTVIFGSVSIPGVAFGIYNSPMLLAVGFLVGTASVVVLFIGALLGNFGIIVGGSGFGLWDVTTAQGITASLGMGTMMGCGFGVVIKNIVPKVASLIKDMAKRKPTQAPEGTQPTPYGTRQRTAAKLKMLPAGIAACVMAAVALLICFLLQLDPLPCVI